MTDAEAASLKLADPVEYRVAGGWWMPGLVYRVQWDMLPGEDGSTPRYRRKLTWLAAMFAVPPDQRRNVVVLVRTRPGRYPDGRMAPLVRRRPSRLRKLGQLPEGWIV